jgi:hypothetical protein
MVPCSLTGRYSGAVDVSVIQRIWAQGYLVIVTTSGTVWLTEPVDVT